MNSDIVEPRIEMAPCVGGPIDGELLLPPGAEYPEALLGISERGVAHTYAWDASLKSWIYTGPTQLSKDCSDE